MRAGFILPVDKRNYKPFRNQPLGSLYLLTILEKEFGNSLDLSLIDLRGLNEEDAIYHIPEKEIYFYSVTTPEHSIITNLVEKIKEVYPKAKHVAGGPHVEFSRENLLNTFDSISLGYGEESIKKIVKDCSKSDLKKVYEEKERLDLNVYPYPLRKFMPKSAVAEPNLLNKEYMNLTGTIALFSRGCPFNCHFCANTTKGPINFRSPELVKEEIEYLKREYGIGALVIKDDNGIPVNKKIAKSLLETIAETNVKWRGQSRANGIQLDMVKLAKESGCIEIAVGIESVSQKVLGIINKKIDFQEAKQYLRTLKNEKIDRRLLLIIGLPGEPKDIYERTIEFIKETEPSSVLLSLLCPIPGAEMYKNPEKFGIKIDKEIPFGRYSSAFGRFDEDEKPNLIFEYEKVTPFGKSMSNEEILNNYMRIQEFLRDNKLNF
jgi:radical SAM superfamily enzyme YgiQ (UPF0313 family)